MKKTAFPYSKRNKYFKPGPPTYDSALKKWKDKEKEMKTCVVEKPKKKGRKQPVHYVFHDPEREEKRPPPSFAKILYKGR